MTGYKKKLIEVSLPLEAINKACKDDKDRKTGHIRNLHKWYAPMPLPAWRAVLFASLVDDPTEDAPEPATANQRIDLIHLLETILPLDAAKDPSLFRPVRDLLRSICTEVPIVMDPFCGGGSTLVEAQRLGLRTIGADLNPIPVLITMILTRYPSLFSDVAAVNPKARQQAQLLQSFGGGLVEDVRYYAGVIGQRAHKQLAQFFPELDILFDHRQQKATVMSWIWSRTVTCPNPACRMVTPLASSFELTRSKKGENGAHWIEPKVATSPLGKKTIEYYLAAGPGQPPKPPKTGHGVRFECLGCHSIIDEKYLRIEAQDKGLGFDLMACVAKLGNGKRVYLPPTPEVHATVTTPEVGWVPELELSTHPQYMGAPRYGMRRVADLFTSRQQKIIEVFAQNVREIRKDIEDDARQAMGERASSYAAAVVTILAICVSKLSQSHNVLVRWKIDSRNGTGKPMPAFDTQTIPIVWDFAENNPFGGSVGDWEATVVPTALRAFDYCVTDAPPAEIYQADAQSAFEIGSGPVLVATDPPYYDNVPYADLSDVFYPLLRFMLHDIHPHLFKTVRAPRSTELVADYHRLGGSRERAQAYFLDGFRNVFTRIRSRILSNTPMTVVYSFKQQEARGNRVTASTGWEVMLRALLEAGFMVTATWPVRTTLENRSRDINSNALASAILIICRPRPESAPQTTRREFLDELKQELPSAIRRLQVHSIAPVDLQQAMIGPGMAVFSKYTEVLDALAKPLSVHDALALINATLDAVLTEQEGDFDADTRWAVAWFEQMGFAEGEFGVAETLSKAKNTSVAGMVEAGILLSKGGKVRLLRPEDLPAGWDPTRDTRRTVWEMVHYLVRALDQGETATAALLSTLGSQADTARELAYRLYAICERKKRAPEALAYNALVQSWPEIVRLAAGVPRQVQPQPSLFEED